MIYGYTRISTSGKDQKTDLQEDAIARYGCDKIFTDTVSGSVEDRPGLNQLLAVLVPGDKVVVWKIDRLARSLQHLLRLIAGFKTMGVEFVSLMESLDTSTAMGKCTLSIIGAFAEFERDTITDRVRAGLDAAKARGVKFGRREKLDANGILRMKELFASGLRAREVAAAMGICTATVYNVLRREGTSAINSSGGSWRGGNGDGN